MTKAIAQHRASVRPILALIVLPMMFACGATDDSSSGSGSALCSGVIFRGVFYDGTRDTQPTLARPSHALRGERIGRTKRCNDTGSWIDGTPVIEPTVWLKVYRVQGVDPAEAIFVETLGVLVAFND